MMTPKEPTWCTDHRDGWHHSDAGRRRPAGCRTNAIELRLIAQADFPTQVFVELTVYYGIFDTELGEVDEPYQVISRFRPRPNRSRPKCWHSSPGRRCTMPIIRDVPTVPAHRSAAWRTQARTASSSPGTRPAPCSTYLVDELDQLIDAMPEADSAIAASPPADFSPDIG